MNIVFIVFLVGLNMFSCSVLAECLLSDRPKQGFPYKLNVASEQCKFVGYNGQTVVTISVRYPEGEVVKPRSLDSSLVVFRLVYLSNPNFNVNAVVDQSTPIVDLDGVQVYEFGVSHTLRFVARDGAPVEVKDGSIKYESSRLYNKNVYARYQYSKVHSDFKRMDDFAMDFLNKILSE